MPTISFKVSVEEARRLRAQARDERATVSAYLRSKALGGTGEGAPKLDMQPHPISGLPFNAAGTHRAVTDEEIANALIDFP